MVDFPALQPVWNLDGCLGIPHDHHDPTVSEFSESSESSNVLGIPGISVSGSAVLGRLQGQLNRLQQRQGDDGGPSRWVLGQISCSKYMRLEDVTCNMTFFRGCKSVGGWWGFWSWNVLKTKNCGIWGTDLCSLGKQTISGPGLGHEFWQMNKSSSVGNSWNWSSCRHSPINVAFSEQISIWPCNAWGVQKKKKKEEEEEKEEEEKLFQVCRR